MNFEHRYEVSIQAAYVRDADAQAVYGWLERNRAEARPRGTFVPKEISEVLVKRNDPLVNLGLAQFTKDCEILRTVYRTGDVAIKCAVLSNPLLGEVFRSLSAHGSVLQQYFFDSEDEGKDFIRSADNELIEAYFTNPSIAAGTLESLFSRSDLFSSLDDLRWRVLVTSALQNPRLHQEENEGWIFDDFGEATTLVRR
jgi:hypothetical protein